MVWIAGIAVVLAGALAACPLAFAGYGLLDHLRSSNDEQA